MPVSIIPVGNPAAIVQGTVATTVGVKFGGFTGSALDARPVNIRQLSFTSVDVTEEYVSIIVDGVEKCTVRIK